MVAQSLLCYWVWKMRTGTNNGIKMCNTLLLSLTQLKGKRMSALHLKWLAVLYPNYLRMFYGEQPMLLWIFPQPDSFKSGNLPMTTSACNASGSYWVSKTLWQSSFLMWISKHHPVEFKRGDLPVMIHRRPPTSHRAAVTLHDDRPRKMEGVPTKFLL